MLYFSFKVSYTFNLVPIKKQKTEEQNVLHSRCGPGI